MTWESDGRNESGIGIFGQLFDRSATKIGNEFQVNTYTNNSQAYPSVTSFNNGNFVVTWESDSQNGSGLGVFGQLFNNLLTSSSTATSTIFTISTTSTITPASSTHLTSPITSPTLANPSNSTNLKTSSPKSTSLHFSPLRKNGL